jgi:hypothetical protein
LLLFCSGCVIAPLNHQPNTNNLLYPGASLLKNTTTDKLGRTVRSIVSKTNDSENVVRDFYRASLGHDTWTEGAQIHPDELFYYWGIDGDQHPDYYLNILTGSGNVSTTITITLEIVGH